MCWKEKYHTARKEHRCSRCSRTIPPGEMYLEGVHVPGRCGGYNYDTDADYDCGTEGFKVHLECSRCLGLSISS